MTQEDLAEYGWSYHKARDRYYRGSQYGLWWLEISGGEVKINKKDQSNVLYQPVFKGKCETKEDLLIIHKSLGIDGTEVQNSPTSL